MKRSAKGPAATSSQAVHPVNPRERHDYRNVN